MFKFDFQIDKNDLEGDREGEGENDLDEKAKNKDEETTVEWYESKEITPSEDIWDNLDVYKVNSLEVTAGDITLTYIKSGYLIHTFDNESTENIKKAEEKHSDLIPGVYEGGAKLWECTDDLISYMSEHYPPNKLKDKRILDLGCGSGVLGIYAYNCGASVHFQDYNEDVLEKITIPNVLLNFPENNRNDLEKVKFYSGDWSKYTELTKDDEKFDVILTSETIYNPDNQQKLLKTFHSKLKEHGEVLLGTKVYYFGVGGGIRQFEELIEKDKRLQSEVLWSSTEGISREIIKIRRRKVQ